MVCENIGPAVAWSAGPVPPPLEHVNNNHVHFCSDYIMIIYQTLSTASYEMGRNHHRFSKLDECIFLAAGRKLHAASAEDITWLKWWIEQPCTNLSHIWLRPALFRSVLRDSRGSTVHS